MQSIIFAFCLFLTLALAIQSDPFYLVLQSSNSTLNGRTLFACHEGAAIEGLCLGPKQDKANVPYSTFRFNYTKSTPKSGLLTWTLKGSDFKISEPLSLRIPPNTNVAIALFEPSEYGDLYLSFDSRNLLYIQSYYDDTVTPPVGGKVKNLYRWYMCEYNYTGYLYTVLSWVYGVVGPQNPSCQKVGVQRVFVKDVKTPSGGGKRKRNKVCFGKGGGFAEAC